MSQLIAAGLGLGASLLAHAGELLGEKSRATAAAVELHATDDMIIGGSIGPGHAKGQDGPLRAVATVIEGPPHRTRVALVSLDVIAVPREVLDDAAREIERRTGIPFDHILISATHTHHAPATVVMHGYGAVPEFVTQVRNAAVEAVVIAEGNLASAPVTRAFFVMGRESTLGQNSRIEMRDGTIAWCRFEEADQLGPTGPFDPDFPVMSFRRPDGSIAAAIFGHSTHSIGTRNPGRRSPAFYGLAAQDFERESGAITTFFEGASGSTHLIKLDGVRPENLAVEAERRVLNALRYFVDQAPELRIDRIDSLKREVSIRVRKFDEAKEEAAVQAYCRTARCDELFGHDTAAVFRQERADLAAYQGEERKTWISAIRVGDIAIVGVPAELFTQLGIDIKKRSPFRYTFIAELANDDVGYVANSDAYRLGGYQMWMGHHSWTERGTGELFVDEAVKLLNELHAR